VGAFIDRYKAWGGSKRIGFSALKDQTAMCGSSGAGEVGLRKTVPGNGRGTAKVFITTSVIRRFAPVQLSPYPTSALTKICPDPVSGYSF
jgi:hypothetical protein